MRKIVAVGVITAAIALGFASVHLRKGVFPAHTIVYRLTFYDYGGNVEATYVVVRRVLADGTWTNTQIRSNGNVQRTNGKLKGHLTSQRADSSWPEHLKVKYIEAKNRKGDVETWLSPDLQDWLKFTTFHEDGSTQSILEAVDVTTP